MQPWKLSPRAQSQITLPATGLRYTPTTSSLAGKRQETMESFQIGDDTEEHFKFNQPGEIPDVLIRLSNEGKTLA
jgi:hypothetical protein